MAEVENILNDEFFADTILLIQKRVLNSIVNKDVQRFQEVNVKFLGDKQQWTQKGSIKLATKLLTKLMLNRSSAN